MNELIFLNAFPNSNMGLSSFKVWKLPLVTTNLKDLYATFRDLSYKKIADCVFHENFVFFKGNPDVVRNVLSQIPNCYVSPEAEEVVFSVHAYNNLITELLYSAFERNLINNNWRVLSKRKKAFPSFDEKYKELCLQLDEENVVLFGLKYKFEIRSSNHIFLWLDIYAPLYSLTGKRRLARSEISEELKNKYVNKAILQPRERVQKLQEILGTLFADKVISLEFCDGTLIQFSKNNYEVPTLEKESLLFEHFRWTLIEEPLLRFKYGFSKNPRRIIDQKAYTRGVIDRISVKAIVARSLRRAFINLFEKIVNGFSGKYMSWPTFSEVTGAEILFNEENDISEVDDKYDEETILRALIEIFSEIKENTVTFIVLPSISRKLYYLMKAEALRRKIPTQLILKETLTKEPLEFTLMNIGVALYAKAGGIPWVLKDPLTSMRGLFVGISFHLDHEMKNIYYGVVEVFDKYGAHLECKARMYKHPHKMRSVKGLFIPRKDMEEILNKLIEKYNPKEIIFHKSAPFLKEEKDAIEHICKKYNVEYCLVHVEGVNPYRIYAPKLNFTPLRGTVVFDQEKSDRAILATTGRALVDYRKIKSWSGIGTPRPLEVTIEKSEGKYNIREISEQILALTKLDWNTTDISVRLPITLKYPRKAARLVKYLKGINEGLVDVAEFRYLI
ncbi:MAG: Piwi domain-containing protein [Candidatus Njordarchaeales archaeon]